MRTSQCDRVVRHLRDFGSITQAEAIIEYGIYRLPPRIYDLKKRGYMFTAEWKEEKNRYGEPTRFKVYRLVEEGDNNA